MPYEPFDEVPCSPRPACPPAFVWGWGQGGKNGGKVFDNRFVAPDHQAVAFL